MVVVAGGCCCWSTASGDAEGDDEVEDATDAADEGGEPDEGVEEDEDDEEDVTSDEDNVFAVGGKICTISIGACLCCSSDLLPLVGEFSGVLVTNVTVEEPGGRALSIALNSLSGTTVVLPIAVLLLLSLILLLETFKAPSVLLVLLTDSSYSSDEDGVDSEDEDWIGKRFRDCSTGKSVATCAATGARVGCCCCCCWRWICSGVRSATNATVLASE